VGEEVWLLSFLTLALEGDERSASVALIVKKTARKPIKLNI
jgi:hypothetical protein